MESGYQELFSAEPMTVLVICLVCAFVVSRFSSLKEPTRNRITAPLPLLLLCASILIMPAMTRDVGCELAGFICLAFAFGFSLSNLRIPSIWSKIIGGGFALLTGWLLIDFARSLL